MKKLITLLLFAFLAIALSAQGPFKPVPLFPTVKEKQLAIDKGLTFVTTQTQIRFDAVIDVAEVNYDKELKTLVPSGVRTFGVGPAIGFQHYVPKSATDPTPVNNYGFAAGILLGDRFKFVAQANIWQLIKFGVIVTPHPAVNIFPIGVFLGTGITF
jgi:hypothetical protein